ncbi:hypothetical protein [Dyella sp.]|jgi:hypothetical protein|uniref:hypothetical protein n=1 Tax=Dyella sp. TaxID=1869338 RepID=UPI002D7847AF|nr:hypothetical protein [Dyella sp.]HET6433006.1 hypothetical protein [Dyella sp.]
MRVRFWSMRFWSMRSWSMLWLALATVVPAAATASDSALAQARNQALLAYQRDLVSVLAPRADAMPLLGAALLARPLPDQPKYNDFHSLIERASQAEDAGAAVQWVHLTDCDARAGSCPDAEALARLTRDDGDNAAVWLIKLGADSGAGNESEAREDLRRAATARLYDDYTGTSLKALATTAGTLPAPAAALDPAATAGAYGVQVVLVYGLAGLQPQPQPGMQAAARLCRDGRDDDATRQQCLRLARVLEWGSSPLARSLGLHLRETLAADPAEQQAAVAERANLAWQVKNFAALLSRAPQDRALSQHLLALARSGGTEMSSMLAALRDAGIAATAPAADASTAPATATSSH